MQVRPRTILLVLGLVSATLWAADFPLMGTWKLNPSRSKLTGPVPRSRFLKIEPSGSGFKYTIDTIDAQGKPDLRTYTGNVDGKQYPTKWNSGTIDWKQIDARTWETTARVAGKVTEESRRVVSPDGKTLTTTTALLGAQGQPVLTIAVYDKQ